MCISSKWQYKKFFVTKDVKISSSLHSSVWKVSEKTIIIINKQIKATKLFWCCNFIGSSILYHILAGYQYLFLKDLSYWLTKVPPSPDPVPSAPPANISFNSAWGTRPSVMKAPPTPSSIALVAYCECKEKY